MEGLSRGLLCSPEVDLFPTPDYGAMRDRIPLAAADPLDTPLADAPIPHPERAGVGPDRVLGLIFTGFNLDATADPLTSRGASPPGKERSIFDPQSHGLRRFASCDACFCRM